MLFSCKEEEGRGQVRDLTISLNLIPINKVVCSLCGAKIGLEDL